MLWLIGSLQAGYGHDNYVGFGRQDNRFFTSGGMTYKINRDLQSRARYGGLAALECRRRRLPRDLVPAGCAFAAVTNAMGSETTLRKALQDLTARRR